MTRTVARLLAESLEAHDVDQVYLRARRELCRADQRADRAQLDPRLIVCRHEGGAGYMAVADGRLRDRAGVLHRLARARPVERDGVAAFGLSRRDADGDAGRPGRAQGFRPAGAAGAELLAAAVRHHQAGHRGQRAGAGLGGDRPRLPPRRKRHARPGRGDPARGHLRRGDRAPSWTTPRPRVVAGPRAEDLDRLAEMLAKAERPLVLVGGALLADAVHDKAVFADLQPARRGMGAADQPDPSPAAAVRRDASELRRLYGHPRAAGADRRDEEGRSDGRAGRAHDRHGQPVLHASRRRRSRNCRLSMSGRTPNEVGRVWRPDLGIAVRARTR